MTDNDIDHQEPRAMTPERERRARALAASPLGQEIGKVPLRIARAIFFGARRRSGSGTALNNATLTLLQLPVGPVGVTCAHVLQSYRERRRVSAEVAMQVGDCNFEPDDVLIDEDRELDLAVLDLGNFPRKRLLCGSWLGSQFHQPVRWPPGTVSTGNYVTFGGYPGKRRREVATGEFEFTSFGAGSVPIAAARDDRLTIQLERDYWVLPLDVPANDDTLMFQALGGLSGAPVVAERKLHFEVVGIVYEFSAAFDLVYVRPTTLIREDGTIRREHETTRLSHLE